MIDIYSDVNNPFYDEGDKRKAVTVDVLSTVTSIGAGLLLVAILPAAAPIIVGVVVGVGVSAGISY